MLVYELSFLLMYIFKKFQKINVRISLSLRLVRVLNIVQRGKDHLQYLLALRKRLRVH